MKVVYQETFLKAHLSRMNRQQLFVKGCVRSSFKGDNVTVRAMEHGETRCAN